MGKYANVKSRKFVKLLQWLDRCKGIELHPGGRHNYKVKCIHTGETYPIPSSHNMIDKNIVEHFKNWLVKREICTADEYDKRL